MDQQQQQDAGEQYAIVLSKEIHEHPKLEFSEENPYNPIGYPAGEPDIKVLRVIPYPQMTSEIHLCTVKKSIPCTSHAQFMDFLRVTDPALLLPYGVAGHLMLQGPWGKSSCRRLMIESNGHQFLETLVNEDHYSKDPLKTSLIYCWWNFTEDRARYLIRYCRIQVLVMQERMADGGEGVYVEIVVRASPRHLFASIWLGLWMKHKVRKYVTDALNQWASLIDTERRNQ